VRSVDVETVPVQTSLNRCGGAVAVGFLASCLSDVGWWFRKRMIEMVYLVGELSCKNRGRAFAPIYDCADIVLI